jgi:methylisocitrate lyase
LASADVSIALYPLSAFRAMNKAAENVYQTLRKEGTQKNVVDTMQTRQELYERINYHAFEQYLDGTLRRVNNFTPPNLLQRITNLSPSFMKVLV